VTWIGRIRRAVRPLLAPAAGQTRIVLPTHLPLAILPLSDTRHTIAAQPRPYERDPQSLRASPTLPIFRGFTPRPVPPPGDHRPTRSTGVARRWEGSSHAMFAPPRARARHASRLLEAHKCLRTCTHPYPRHPTHALTLRRPGARARSSAPAPISLISGTHAPLPPTLGGASNVLRLAQVRATLHTHGQVLLSYFFHRRCSAARAPLPLRPAAAYFGPARDPHYAQALPRALTRTTHSHAGLVPLHTFSAHLRHPPRQRPLTFPWHEPRARDPACGSLASGRSGRGVPRPRPPSGPSTTCSDLATFPLTRTSPTREIPARSVPPASGSAYLSGYHPVDFSALG
jgi:hypothetical protein